MGIDISSIQKQFPILQKMIGCNRLVYLDNSATTQRPKSVIDAISRYYEETNANVFRSAYSLARRSSELYQRAKTQFLKFINGQNTGGVAFTKNATEALNAVAFALFYSKAKEGTLKGKWVVTTYLEHNSNYLPWARLKEWGVKLKLVSFTKDFELDYADLENFVKSHKNDIALIAVTLASNVSGTVVDITRVAELARKYKIPVLVDAAQGVAHLPINVKEWGIDFLAFSGHKMYGPFGIGGLYFSNAIADKLTPFIVGGGTVTEVTEDKIEFKEKQYSLVGGTPSVADAVGLTAAVGFLTKLGMENVHNWESYLVEYTLEKIRKFTTDFGDLVQYVGGDNKESKSGVFAFYSPLFLKADPVRFFDNEAVAVRGGKHCAHLFHKYAGVPYTLRMSLAVYNTPEDIDIFFDVLESYIRINK